MRQFISLVLLLGCVSLGEPLLAQPGYAPSTLVPQPMMPLPSVGIQPSAIGMGAGIEPGNEQASGTSNQMLWQQYQALQLGGSGVGSGGDCQTCSGPGGYNRCGCNAELFPWTNGPGDCDQWCVGPKWGVEASGLFMFRDDADWDRVIADVGGGAQPVLVDQFDHGAGARLFVTGYNEAGFGVQVGYEGVNDWVANLAYAPDALVAGETREFAYESRLNSVEINFLPNVPYAWKWYSGFRYVELSEDFLDTNTAAKPIPAPVAVPVAPVAFFDTRANQLLKNRLFGLQVGGRRDTWQLGNRVTLQTYGNCGVYCNKFRQKRTDSAITTIIAGDDIDTVDVNEFSQNTTVVQTAVRRDSTEVAFLGEAGIAAAFRLNRCTALRAGYQILAVDGVGEGLATSLSPGFDSATLIYHGLQFGLEYRR